MDSVALRRVVAALALGVFFCAAALAIADVVRISPPWTVESDRDAFVRADEPVQPLPAPMEEKPALPESPLADEPRSCVGDANCVKPKERKEREDRERGQRDEKRESDERRGEAERAAETAEPRAAREDEPAELVAGTLEDAGELSEGVLDEDVLPEPLCDEPDACLELLAETFDCESLESCQALYFGELEDPEAESDAGMGEAEEPPPVCDGEDSCAALLLALFGCESFDACEQDHLGVIEPHGPPTDAEPESVVGLEPDDADPVLEPQPD